MWELFAPSAVPTIFMTPAARCEVNFSAFFYQALMPSIKLLLLLGNLKDPRMQNERAKSQPHYTDGLHFQMLPAINLYFTVWKHEKFAIFLNSYRFHFELVRSICCKIKHLVTQRCARTSIWGTFDSMVGVWRGPPLIFSLIHQNHRGNW